MGFNRERGLPRVPTVHVTRMRTSQRGRYHFMGCVRVRNCHLLCHSKVFRSAPFLQFSQATHLPTPLAYVFESLWHGRKGTNRYSTLCAQPKHGSDRTDPEMILFLLTWASFLKIVSFVELAVLLLLDHDWITCRLQLVDMSNMS